MRANNEKVEIDQAKFTEAFIGNVDSRDAKVVKGWVIFADDVHAPVRVALWLGEKRLVETLANIHRADLVHLGRGDGNCAFELVLPAYLKNISVGSDDKLSLQVECKNVRSTLLESVLETGVETLPPHVVDRMVNAFQHVLLQDALAEPVAASKAKSSKVASRSFGPMVDRLYRPARKVDISNSESTGAPNTRIELSPYTRYTLQRMNMSSSFDLDANPWEADEALMWYLDRYSVARKPLRVPLSKEEVTYCNEMQHFPNCRFGLSRLHHFYLLRERYGTPLADLLNDDDVYRNEIFRWVDGVARDLQVEDVLVPESYIAQMRLVRHPRDTQAFPINDYFEIKRHHNGSWHCFNTEIAMERGCMFLAAYLESCESPASHQFMTDSVRRALFEERGEDGECFLEKIAALVLDEQTRESLSMVDVHEVVAAGLANAGYSVATGRYTSIDGNGDRREGAANVLSEEAAETCDLQVIGPLAAASGLGQATRLSASVLTLAGLEPNLVNFDMDNPAPTGYSTTVNGTSLKKARVNLLHLNAESIPLVPSYMPNVFADSYNIGYFFWELDSPAACHSLALEMLDEIWVSTEYGVSQYEKVFDGPVVNVGMTFEKQDTPPKAECRRRLMKEFGISETDTVFLTTFDSYSFVQRKNPTAVIKAFKEAFPNDASARLVIKTQNRNNVFDPTQIRIWRSIDMLIADDPRITLVNKTFRYEDLLWFKKAADCYVSLHRSEGWGFGMIEAMTLDVPVIATGYSGNLDFCHADNCWLVGADEKFLSSSDYIFVEPGQKWAEPRVSEAAQCMKEVHCDPAERKRRAERAQNFVEKSYGNDAIATRYRERIERIVDSFSESSLREVA